ncbi:MAG: hypothetical protein IPL53_19715 [Ignavibacteria bacterium]|nr:hypothetical protein [Ignavibacteria bacterium]
MIWKTQKQFYDKIQPNIFTGSLEEYENIKELQCEDKISKLRDFKKSNYWILRNYCIYYQRPLRSQKNIYQNANSNKTKSYSSQFAFIPGIPDMENISDLRYSALSENIVNQPLPIDWKLKIAKYLQIKEKIYISKPKKSKRIITKNI